MGELINLRRARRATERATKEKSAAANRVAHGTPKALRKISNSEKLKLARTAESHRLDHKKEP